MLNLNRLTVGHDAVQDRIALDGAGDGGQVVRLWLTRRLSDRLVATLCEQLAPDERAGSDRDGSSAPTSERTRALEAARISAQIEARIFRPQVEPVAIAPDAAQYLVTEARLAHARAGQWRLELRALDFEGAVLLLSSRQLRQWLDALYRAYAVARWPNHPWPAWFARAAAPAQKPG